MIISLKKLKNQVIRVIVKQVAFDWPKCIFQKYFCIYLRIKLYFSDPFDRIVHAKN